jgi:hypothetical protein
LTGAFGLGRRIEHVFLRRGPSQVEGRANGDGKIFWHSAIVDEIGEAGFDLRPPPVRFRFDALERFDQSGE